MVGVAMIAMATLAYEVLLTRIFSVTLWYHFGFLAISLALLGTAASAVLCFLFPERLQGQRHLAVLRVSAMAFAFFAPAAVAFHVSVALPPYEQVFAFYAVFGAQLTLFFLAFFSAGLCISVALYRYAESVSRVYFFDLVGASIGSLLVVPMLYTWSALALVFVVSAMASLAALAFGRGVARPLAQGLALLATLAFLAIGFVNDDLGLLRIHLVKSYRHGTFQNAEPAKYFEKWSPISRVAVMDPGGIFSSDEMLKITNDAGAPTLMLRFDGDYSKMQHLLNDPVQLAHRLKRDAHVLVIGTGGGIDVLTALVADQAKITAVEINPVMGDIVTEHYADFVGRIFDDPRVELHLQEGRNFVAGSPESYDIIQFMMIDSWGGGAAAGAYVFSENSLYTTEAVGDYLAHLKPGGILAMTRYYQWAEALRLTNLFADHLESHGIHDAQNRIVVVKKTKLSIQPIVTVFLKNGLFTPREIDIVVEMTQQSGAEILYAPHLPASALPAKGYDALFRVAVDPTAYGTTREAFVESSRWNLTAPTDDHPFFFFTRRLSEAFSINPREHAARRLAIPLLYGMLAVFGAIALLTVFLPLYLRASTGIREAPFRTRSLVYFMMLGAGFMLVEISLIQRLTIFLGHPTWSFVVVLSTLLFSSGLGSLYSARWPDGSPQKLQIILGLMGVLLLCYWGVLYDRFIEWMAFPRLARVSLVVAVMSPLGFLMGMCFPMGVQIVRRFHEGLVPWGWGVNGAFSVFASILSIVLAIGVGFKATLALGILCYAVALAIVTSFVAAGRGGRERREG